MPGTRASAKPLADEQITTQIATGMEAGAVHVHRDTPARYCEVGHADRQPRIIWRHRHLLLDLDALLLEQPEELQLQRRPDSRSVGFEPRARIVHISGLARPGFGSGLCQRLQFASRTRPAKVFVVPLDFRQR